MSIIIFLHHVWRQKASEVYTCNRLPNFGKQAFSCGIFGLKEGSHAEVGQVIAGVKFRSFLTPDVA